MQKVALRKPSERLSARALAIPWSWAFLCGLLLLFSLIGPGFFGFFNLQNILSDMDFVLLLAMGQTFVILSGGIDLSVGYTMGLATVVAARVALWAGAFLPLPMTILLAVLAGLLVGCLPGLVNGVIVARFAMPPFIVTLGMYGIARGAGFLLANGQPVSVTADHFGDLGNNYLLYFPPGHAATFFRPPTDLSSDQLRNMIQILPLQLIPVCLIVLLCVWLLTRTRFGLHIYAIGGNREAALRAGIPVARRTVQIYLISACLAALAGVFYLLRYTSGTADAGDPLLIDSIAAVAIGGASLFGGEGTLLGTLAGTLIIAVIQNGLIIVGIDPFWQFIAVGIVIIIAVMIDRAKTRMTRT